MKTTIPAAAAHVIRVAAPPAEQAEMGDLLVELDSMDLVAPSMPRKTMRFHAAVAAMQGMLANEQLSNLHEFGVVDEAVAFADLLLARLDQPAAEPEPA